MIANHEENRELDVRRLRESGVRVHVTEIETVPEAVETFDELFDDVLGWERPDWLAEARELWCGPIPEPTQRVAIPIWRDPWMVVGGATFTSDLARRLGWANAFADQDRHGPLPEGRPWPTSRRPASTWCCSPTSPTSSPRTTVPRRSRARRPGWSAAAAHLVRPLAGRGGARSGNADPIRRRRARRALDRNAVPD